MQKRLRLSLAFTLFAAGTLTQGCGKSSGGKGGDKPTITPPSTVPGETAVTKPGDGTKPTNDQPTTNKPGTVVNQPNKPIVVDTSVVSNTAVTGLWAISIAQKPRSCSTIYDLRDPKSANVHLLCPAKDGKSISLQSESFTRTVDNGEKATWKRTKSTCASSAGTVFLSYKVDASNKLVLSEGTKTSPALLPLAESNLAADLKTASTLHGRSIVRGCFQSGNLAAFTAVGASR